MRQLEEVGLRECNREAWPREFNYGMQGLDSINKSHMAERMNYERRGLQSITDGGT